ECMSALRSATSTAASVPGFSPATLRSAYGLAKASASAGQGETIAIVTAYSDPKAAADLAVYRQNFKLSACGATGRCLRIINEHGATTGLPSPNASWAKTDATELDVVSALCPQCHLLLVEAASNSLTDLGTAENTAVAKGAKFVLNGWAAPEFVGQDAYEHYF